MPDDTITLDGRKFTSVSQAITANQDDYILAHLRVAGAIDVLSDLDGIQRTKEKRAEDLLTQILLSGKTHHILAGLLTEQGRIWTRDEADANAARFSQITSVEEKSAMRSSIMRFIIGFFSLGEPSSETSQKSSSRSAKVPPTKNAAPPASGTSRR
jgi:hypothetical protein